MRRRIGSRVVSDKFASRFGHHTRSSYCLPSAEHGFTLIELLVVVSIIGILAGIAVASLVYARTRAYNAQAKTDLRNAIVSEESIVAGGDAYISCADQATCEATLPGFRGTRDVSIEFSTPTADSFLGVASHPKGDAVYEFDSTIGILTER